MRVKFRKGEQRKFLQRIMEKTNSPSLKELSNRLDINYSRLKNYFVERRFLPNDLFQDLCFLGDVNKTKLDVKVLEEGWGQKIPRKRNGPTRNRT